MSLRRLFSNTVEVGCRSQEELLSGHGQRGKTAADGFRPQHPRPRLGPGRSSCHRSDPRRRRPCRHLRPPRLEIFRRAFRFRLKHRNQVHPGRPQKETMRTRDPFQVVEGVVRKAFLSAAEMVGTRLPLLGWASVPHRERRETHCPQGQFPAPAFRRAIRMLLDSIPDPCRKAPNWMFRLRKYSVQSAFTLCT